MVEPFSILYRATALICQQQVNYKVSVSMQFHRVERYGGSVFQGQHKIGRVKFYSRLNRFDLGYNAHLRLTPASPPKG